MPRILLAIALVALFGAGCAPEAMNNRAATGFDGFVNKISRVCAPISLGRYSMSSPLMGGAGDGSYDYWLDQTSRLYYQRISPAQYRESLNAFFGAGNGGTIDCIVGNLPPGPS
ncbi:MAG: hypothetical protein IT521_01335 [Burkholderiales bacterium]|nr:hypothetical protein [Burkholderiales bacterium]